MHSPPQHPTVLGLPSAPPRPSAERPGLPRRARTTRGTTSDSWTFDTRRGYSHYSQNTSSAPLPQHPHIGHGQLHAQAQAHAHTVYVPAFLQTPYIPVIGALPAIAAGVQSIRKWHARAEALMPQGIALHEAHATLQRHRLNAADDAPTDAHAAHIALGRLLKQHEARVALHKAAVVRAITEGSTKTASACCELFTFMLVPVPAIHAFFGVEAGSMLMRPYTTLIIPAAFLVTAGLQIAYYTERFQEAFLLWQASRTAAIGATGAQPGASKLPAFGDASLPNALMRECLYTACQVFFWTAFACGMSAASGSMFVGLISPPVAIVCLLVGVAGTTAMHMGWANAYGTPDRIDDATPEDFGSLSERRQRYAALSEEARHIETFRLLVGAHLPSAQASMFQTIIPLLERLPQASLLINWLCNRWFAQAADDLGPVVVAHLKRLCLARLTHQAAEIDAMRSTLSQMRTPDGQACIDTLPEDVKTQAEQALLQQQQQFDNTVAAHANVHALLVSLEESNAAESWRSLAKTWLADEHPDLTDAQVSGGVYQLLVSEPYRDIAQEKEFLTWIQRVALNTEP